MQSGEESESERSSRHEISPYDLGEQFSSPRAAILKGSNLLAFGHVSVPGPFSYDSTAPGAEHKTCQTVFILDTKPVCILCSPPSRVESFVE